MLLGGFGLRSGSVGRVSIVTVCCHCFPLFFCRQGWVFKSGCQGVGFGGFRQKGFELEGTGTKFRVQCFCVGDYLHRF